MRALLVVMMLVSGCGRETPEARPDPITKGKSHAPVEPSPTSHEAPEKTSAAKCVASGEPVTVEGTATEAVESVTRAELDDAFCPNLADARKCLAALTKGEKVFEATVEAKLEIGPDGTVKAMLDGGTLQDQAMRSCVRDALLATKMPNGPGSGRYSIRIYARAKQ